MLEVQGKIEWMSTLEVDTNKPGIVPGVITPTFYGCVWSCSGFTGYVLPGSGSCDCRRDKSSYGILRQLVKISFMLDKQLLGIFMVSSAGLFQ